MRGIIPATSPVGTKVCVEDLFFNTPARLKYMKSQQAELSHIIDIVNRLGLAHPEISFSLISDGKEMTRTAGTGQLRQAIAGIYGLASAKKMVEIENADLDFEISGFVSLPELHGLIVTISVSSSMVVISKTSCSIVPFRWIRSKLMVGRFPLAVIHIQIDPYLADVNVHPTKQEVRISKERELMALVSEAIAKSLKEQTLIPYALENLAKSTVRNVKGRANDFATERKYALL